jgi:hypothetical protein
MMWCASPMGKLHLAATSSSKLLTNSPDQEPVLPLHRALLPVLSAMHMIPQWERSLCLMGALLATEK